MGAKYVARALDLSIVLTKFSSIVVEFAKESRPRRDVYDGERGYGYDEEYPLVHC
jgi:hypothetical protein